MLLGCETTTKKQIPGYFSTCGVFTESRWRICMSLMEKHCGPRSEFSSGMQTFSDGCWLLEFHVVATSKDINTGWVPICDSAHSWWFYSTAPPGNLGTSTLVWYLVQSHYPDTELTSPHPVLLMSSAKLRGDKYQFCKVLLWFDRELNSRSTTREACALTIR